MKEPEYNYDWRHPIEVPNLKNKSGVSIEKGSFKWFKYWLENDCTYNEVAEQFKTSESNITSIASLFKWKERKRNYEDFISREREKNLINNYNKFVEDDFKNSNQILLGIYSLIEMSFIVLNLLPNLTPDGKIKYEIPEGFGVLTALDIIKTYPKTAREMHNQVLRDLKQPEKINDKQDVNTVLNANVKGDATVNLLDKVKKKRRELNDIRSNRK